MSGYGSERHSSCLQKVSRMDLVKVDKKLEIIWILQRTDSLSDRLPNWKNIIKSVTDFMQGHQYVYDNSVGFIQVNGKIHYKTR